MPPEQAVDMADALEGAGVGHELLLLSNAGHDERLIVPVQQPSFGLLAPTIVVVVGAVVIGTVVLTLRRRRHLRY